MDDSAHRERIERARLKNIEYMRRCAALSSHIQVYVNEALTLIRCARTIDSMSSKRRSRPRRSSHPLRASLATSTRLAPRRLTTCSRASALQSSSSRRRSVARSKRTRACTSLASRRTSRVDSSVRGILACSFCAVRGHGSYTRVCIEGMCAKIGKVRRIKFYKDARGGLKVGLVRHIWYHWYHRLTWCYESLTTRCALCERRATRL